MSHDPKSKDFDPYSAWLGIPPGIRPPAPGELLGVAPGECDADRILEAAMERKNLLDRFALSEHSKLASELAGEVAHAMSLLLERTTSNGAAVQDRSLSPASRTEARDDGTPERSASLPRSHADGSGVLTTSVVTQDADKGQARAGRAVPRRDDWLEAIGGEEDGVLRKFLRLMPVILLGVALFIGVFSLASRRGPNAPEPPSPSQGDDFVILFRADDLARWGEAGRRIETWRVENDVIAARLYSGRRGKWLFSKEAYGDYTLRLQMQLSIGATCFLTFRADRRLREGISADAYLQVPLPPSQPTATPAQVIDSSADVLAAGIFAGQDVDNRTMPTVPVSLKPLGSWNDVELKVERCSLQVSINGERIPPPSNVRPNNYTTRDRTAWHACVPKRPQGEIGFQAAGGEVRLKNIRVENRAAPPPADSSPPDFSDES